MSTELEIRGGVDYKGAGQGTFGVVEQFFFFNRDCGGEHTT